MHTLKLNSSFKILKYLVSVHIFNSPPSHSLNEEPHVFHSWWWLGLLNLFYPCFFFLVRDHAVSFVESTTIWILLAAPLGVFCHIFLYFLHFFYLMETDLEVSVDPGTMVLGRLLEVVIFCIRKQIMSVCQSL